MTVSYLNIKAIVLILIASVKEKEKRITRAAKVLKAVKIWRGLNVPRIMSVLNFQVVTIFLNHKFFGTYYLIGWAQTTK